MGIAQGRPAEELFEQFRALGQETVYDAESCKRIEALVAEIQELKREKNAVILAHNYQRPEIFEVADFVGDSLELARHGRDVAQDTIVLCGVHFMAETAKILSPQKRVLIPDARAGCSLAESVDADALVERRDELRKVFPDLKVVSYVNTTAAVKAVTDVCCTSSNAVKIVNAVDADNILFVPDRNLAAYVSQNTTKNVIAWDGDCYVHQQIRPDVIRKVREAHPGIRVVAHPECRRDVLEEADAVLSTSGMIKYAKETEAPEFLIVTECGLSDRLLMEVPEKRFYKACQLCRYMKMITLEGTRDSLVHDKDEVILSPQLCEQARRSLDRMLELS
ncbi:MAG TPA: quinolinate synthase NadA [Candidatus Limnocylindrales bacterium]|nr:quinolinate synthase NadA [Candidatus Limnocylindrales bacterium]